MYKQVLINREATDLRVALLEDGELVELFVENFDTESMLGNIYKGRVEGIVPGLKAVFVNIGQEKNAFLHFSDVLQEYDLPLKGKPLRAPPPDRRSRRTREDDKYEEEMASDDDYIEPQVLPDEIDEDEDDDATSNGKDEKKARQKRPARRSRTLNVGDSILVQVIKEPINEKGARVTSYISIPGRYLVYMPFSERGGGISRKIESPSQRRRLRDLMKSFEVESGSLIMRTAGVEEAEEAVREDYLFLMEQWKKIKRNNRRMPMPSLVNDEQNTLQRLVRDTLRNEIDEILMDSRPQMRELIQACEAMAPRMVDRIHLFESPRNMFEVFEIEQQFQKALKRKVWMKNGGFLVIDETEALTAIDVNSGKYVGVEDQDSVILKTNLAACEVVSRQLRLRDIGGLIVVDFIDMTNKEHQQQVLKELKRCLNRDEAKYALTGFSEFGLVEMTRKRVRMSLARVMFEECPYCAGAGKIMRDSQIWKAIKYALLDLLSNNENIESVQIIVHSQIRTYLESEVIDEIRTIAHRYQVKLNFVTNSQFHHEQYEILTQLKSTRKGKEAPAVSSGDK